MDSNHRTQLGADLQSAIVAAWLTVRVKKTSPFHWTSRAPVQWNVLQFATTFVIITDSAMCGTIATIIIIIRSVEQWRVWDSNSCVAFQRPNGLANRPLHQTWVTLRKNQSMSWTSLSPRIRSSRSSLTRNEFKWVSILVVSNVIITQFSRSVCALRCTDASWWNRTTDISITSRVFCLLN